MLRRFASLQSVAITCTSCSVIIARYQTTRNNKKHALLGFSIVRFLRPLLRKKSSYVPPTDKTELTPLNKVRRLVRSSQLLRDITCRSVVTLWHSTISWVSSGVFSKAKVHTLNVLVLGFCEHCLWRLVRTLVSEWAMVREMLFTLIYKCLLHLLRFSQKAYTIQ